MTTITGTKAIVNVGQKNRALDVNAKEQIVGSPENIHVGSSQKWTILKVREGVYSIHNAFYNKYLGWQGPKENLKLILSVHAYDWEITSEGGKYYKIEVTGVGSVCSLKSSEPDTPVVISNFLGQNEEWVLETVAVDPAIPGRKRFKSVAYPDRAITDGTSIQGGALHHHSGPCNQRWTISEPNSEGAYSLYNDEGGYLSLNGKKAVISAEKHLWDIVQVHVSGHYKLEVHQVGTVCSLRSDEEGAEVFIGNYVGNEEEWTLEDYPVSLEGRRTERCPGLRA